MQGAGMAAEPTAPSLLRVLSPTPGCQHRPPQMPTLGREANLGHLLVLVVQVEEQRDHALAHVCLQLLFLPCCKKAAHHSSEEVDGLQLRGAGFLVGRKK